MRLKSVLAMSSPNPFLPPLKQWVLVWQLYTWDAANFVLLPLNQKSNPNNSLASIKQTPFEKWLKWTKWEPDSKRTTVFWGFFPRKRTVLIHVPKVLEMVLYIVMNPAHTLLTSHALLLHLWYSVSLGNSLYVLLKFTGKSVFIWFIVHVLQLFFVFRRYFRRLETTNLQTYLIITQSNAI